MNKQEVLMLQRAAREGNALALGAWASQVETELKIELMKEFNEMYEEQLDIDIDNWCIAIMYTLKFSEETDLDKDTLDEFMNDLFVTVDMFRTGEFNPDDYKEELEECGIVLDDYRYKPRKHKTVLVVGNIDLENVSELEKNLVDKGYNVIYQSSLDLDEEKLEQDLEKVRLANRLYVCNKNKQISSKTKKYIDKAKELYKTVEYMED